MQRFPVTGGGLAAEQTTTEVKESAKQTVGSINASRGPVGVGHIFDVSSHMAAIPPLIFVLLGGGLFVWLVYKTHLSFSANLGRG